MAKQATEHKRRTRWPWLALLLAASAACVPCDGQDKPSVGYYANDFEDRDDSAFWTCGQPQVFGLDKATADGYFVVHSKGLAGDETYSGKKALRLDVTLNDKGEKFTWAAWKGPVVKIPLSKPVFLSGRVYVQDLPKDVSVGFGWSIKGTSPHGNFTQTSGVMPLVKTEHGWMLFEQNVSEKAKAMGWKDDTYLDHWMLFIRSKTPFSGQRLVIYLDDVKAGSSLEAGTDEPKLVFSDDFERDDVGGNWRAAQGAWTVKDRALYVVGPGVLVCTKPVGKDVRIEYDGIADDPADLSAIVGLPPDQWVAKGYFFGFGAEGNKRNKLLRQKRELAQDTKLLPKAKHWHHVVIEKRGRQLRMLVDGQLSLEAVDVDPLTDGEHFALYVWGTGKFDNVRAYAIPATAAKDEEPKPLVKLYTGFEHDAAGLEVEGAAKVTDLPNWFDTGKGKVTVPDKCVQLDGPSALRLRFAPIESGFVEMDVMAEAYKGKPLRVAFHGKDNAELAALFVDPDGTFCADVGQKPPLRFEHSPDFFAWKGMKERLYLRPKRWFTLRLGFDCKKGRFYAALLNYFALLGDTQGPNFLGHWLPLGDKIPFLKTGEQVVAVSIRVTGETTLCVDNFFAYGPTHPFLVNGMDYRFPAKKLLGVKYEDRRDPLTLRNYSLRHVLPRAQPCRTYPRMRASAPEFVAAGIRYSELLVQQAFLEEDMQMLERVAFYVGKQAEVTALRRKVAQTENDLDALHQAFAAAYLNSLDKAALQKNFSRKAEALAATLAEVSKEAKSAIGKLASLAPTKIQAPEPAAAGGSAKGYRWLKDKGCFMDADKPAYLHPTASWGDWHRMGEFERILDLPGCTRTDRKTYNCNPGEYSDYESFKYNQTYIDTRSDATFIHCLSLGPPDLWMHVPAWWAEKHGDDRDIYIQDRHGKLVAMPEGKKWYHVDAYGGPAAHLNYWHPKVKDFFHGAGLALGRFFKTTHPGRAKVFVWGGEEIHSVYNNETGYNPSARAAFREHLRKTYRDIADLNAKWGSSYKSFDKVDVPADFDKPTGVAYEFARFRNDGYLEMVKTLARGLRTHCPEVPLSGYLNIHHGGTDRKVGFDLPRMFETLDIFTYHTYRTYDWQPMNRCMDSLRKAYPQTALGVLEWGAAMVNNPQLCDEECYKVNGLAMLFDSMAWGQSFHDLWRGIGTGAAQGDNWPEPRLGNTVLRYSTTHMPLSFARIRKLGRPALECPTITPDVAILEVTSSFLNALPTNLYHLGPRLWMANVATQLEEAGWNYGYLYEQLLLDGKQQLDGIQTVIVPLGYCCPPELADKLLAWTQAGGHLILVGPCGLYNQYGKPDDRLLRAAFGESDWTQKTARSWQPRQALKPKDAKSAVYEAALGKGKVILFSDLDDPFPLPKLLQTVAELTRRTIQCTNPDFKLVVRESPDSYYLYVVNTNARPLRAPEHHLGLPEVRDDRHARPLPAPQDNSELREVRNYAPIRLPGPSEGDITFARPIKSAADVGVTHPVSIPLRVEGGSVRFTLRLAQGEGTLIRLAR